MIQIASRKDLKRIYELATQIPEDSKIEWFPENAPAKTMEFIYKKWLEGPIFIYVEDDKIVGALGLCLNKPWWSEKEIFSDYLFFVDPEHRNFKVAKALLCAGIDYAKLNKKTILLQFVTKNRIKAKEKLLKMCGYEEMGVIAGFNGEG